MQGLNAYQLPAGLPADSQVVEIGGFAYVFSASTGTLMNLQLVSAKFKSFEELDAYMKSKPGGESWLRPSQST